MCGGTGCFRKIKAYKRRAIELFPYREGRIPIARFQCRLEMRTFSLLPYQLAPYRLYTIESMILAVLVWCEFHRDGEGESPKAVASFHDDCRVTPWLLRNWLGVVVMGFRGAHPVLCRWYELSNIHSGKSQNEMLEEVYDYHRSFGARGPPSISELREMVRRYSRHTECHLLGIPSQERRGLSAQ